METIEEAVPRDVRIDLPFIMEIEHPTLDVRGMFNVTRALNLMQLQTDRVEAVGRLKQHLVLDVMSVTPELTTVKVTLVRPMSYDDLYRHIEDLFQVCDECIFARGGRLKRLIWDSRGQGVPIDEKLAFQRIR